MSGYGAKLTVTAGALAQPLVAKSCPLEKQVATSEINLAPPYDVPRYEGNGQNVTWDEVPEWYRIRLKSVFLNSF
jgi:hypothetical protein